MFELEAAAVLFDSDGVSVDSRRVVEMAWRQLAAEFGLDVDRLLSEHAGSDQKTRCGLACPQREPRTQ